jgi:serine protease Do
VFFILKGALIMGENDNLGQDNLDSNQNTDYSYYDPSMQQTQQKTKAQLKAEAKAARKQAREQKRRASNGRGGAGYVAKLVVSAVVFGMIAGATMFGVNKLGEKLDPDTSNIEIPTTKIESVTLGDKSNSTTASLVQTEDDVDIQQMNVKEVVKAAMPSIVAINGTTTVSTSSSYGMFGYPYGGMTQEATTSGTGIIVGKNDTELLIVTNAHVVDGVSNLTCTFVDEESVDMTVKGSKANKDIAVVAVNLSDIKQSTLSKIAIAELGDSDSMELGDQVVAIGNALGEGQSATVGYISALNRSITIDGTEYSNLIMTDAAINPGNSGGALLNAEGRVIGINSAKSAQTDVEGMGYAIPISSVRDILDNLMTKKTRQKVSDDKASYLGISGVDVTSSIAKAYGYPQGILLQKVEDGSAASKAGLLKNDIITSFDGETVSSFTDLKNLMKYYESGETVTIEYYRVEKGEYVLMSVDVTLGHNSN